MEEDARHGSSSEDWWSASEYSKQARLGTNNRTPVFLLQWKLRTNHQDRPARTSPSRVGSSKRSSPSWNVRPLRRSESYLFESVTLRRRRSMTAGSIWINSQWLSWANSPAAHKGLVAELVAIEKTPRSS